MLEYKWLYEVFIMKVSAVSFTSGTNSKGSKKVVQPCTQPCTCNYNRVSDILPVTVGLGAGLMFAYALKTGKVEAAGKKVKSFVGLA